MDVGVPWSIMVLSDHLCITFLSPFQLPVDLGLFPESICWKIPMFLGGLLFWDVFGCSCDI